MRITVFGLTLSSSWGNGHATLWRGLCRALAKRGHEVSFFEKDVPYYREHRDQTDFPGVRWILYSEWNEIRETAKRILDHSDVGVVTSYCPDGRSAARLLLDSRAKFKTFYDLDTPITLSELANGKDIPYLPQNGLQDFDLVFSYTGGRALDDLKTKLHARSVIPLYGSVDPETHRPNDPVSHYRSALSYLGTYAEDRQDRLSELFLKPAQALSDHKFTLAGSQYPEDFPWAPNIFYFRHLPPSEHSAFFSSSRMTLNVTRKAMADSGYCPSGRLFEAAASGVPILSDDWEGLGEFFRPNQEILVARNTQDAIDILRTSDRQLARIAKAARERVFESHTADHRARDFEKALENPKRWGIIPAAGAGTRIQPLAFSKELLPVGSRLESGVERPRAVSEFLVERMIAGGAKKICFVLSPGKSDIFEYYCGTYGKAHLCYVVQPGPVGLCDAIFRALPLIAPDDLVMVGLPDTVWFPEDGFRKLDEATLSFLLFEVEQPQFFDTVITDEKRRVLEIEVKPLHPKSSRIWGAFQAPGSVLHALHALWEERGRRDEYFGTLVNAYLARGGVATGIPAGEVYVDVGTLHGYRKASELLATSKYNDSKSSDRIASTLSDPR